MAYIPEGDIVECDKWLPWAKGQLLRLKNTAPGTHTTVLYPAENVEVMIQTRPEKIMITVSGGFFITLLDRDSVFVSSTDYINQRQKRLFYRSFTDVSNREGYKYGGKTVFPLGAAHPSGIYQRETQLIYGGNWRSKREAFSWADEVFVPAASAYFRDNLRIYYKGAPGIVAINHPAMAMNMQVYGAAYKCGVSAMSFVANTEEIIDLYPALSPYPMVFIAVFKTGDIYLLGGRVDTTPQGEKVLTFSAPIKCSFVIDHINDFSGDALSNFSEDGLTFYVAKRTGGTTLIKKHTLNNLLSVLSTITLFEDTDTNTRYRSLKVENASLCGIREHSVNNTSVTYHFDIFSYNENDGLVVVMEFPEATTTMPIRHSYSFYYYSAKNKQVVYLAESFNLDTKIANGVLYYRHTNVVNTVESASAANIFSNNGGYAELLRTSSVNVGFDNHVDIFSAATDSLLMVCYGWPYVYPGETNSPSFFEGTLFVDLKKGSYDKLTNRIDKPIALETTAITGLAYYYPLAITN